MKPPAPLVIRLTDENGNVRPIREIEDEVMALAVQVCGGNKSVAINQLGVSRSKFYRRKKEFARG